MTVCALILAHHKPQLLGRLVSRLDRAGIASIVHVDAKINDAPFRSACEQTKARFLPNRVEVYWGGFSMVEATARLARTALEDPAHTHFYHISGDTYPIISDGGLLNSLTQDFDFIDAFETKPNSPAYRRISQAYLPDTRIGGLRHGLHHEERFLSAEAVAAFEDAARVFQIKSSMSFPWRYSKGANWWGLRRRSLELCLSVFADRPTFVDWFRYASNPDESFFNTIALNFLDPARCKPSPVFSLWNVVPAPYEFVAPDDIRHFEKTQCAFARKMSPNATDLMALLDARLVSA